MRPNGTQERNRKIDSAMGKSTTMLGQLKLISASKMQLWHALLIALFVAGFVSAIVWAIALDYFSRSGAQQPTQITNKAQVTFNDASGNPQTPVESNVVTTIIGANAMNISVSKEGRLLPGQSQDQSGQVQVRLFNPGTLTLVTQVDGQLAANGSGAIAVPAQYFGTTYDVVVKAAGYLSRKKAGVQISTTPITFATLFASDFNGDDTVNTLDFGMMNQFWGASSPSPAYIDIDGNSQVNTLDFSFMNAHWFAIGEDPRN